MGNGLTPDEVAAIQPRKLNPNKRKPKKVPEHLKTTRMAKDIKAGAPVPPVPKNKSLAEIVEMDPDDPAFKLQKGRPRTSNDLTPDDIKASKAPVEDAIRADKQKRANKRRAKARKAASTTVAAVEVLHASPTSGPASKYERKKGIYDEDKVVAEGILSLDDWDDEELIRGYRRDRNGKFSNPPKFIPREIQDEIFKRIVARGNKKMQRAYLNVIDGLTDLAENSSSDKVRLDAMRELMNRIVGKVPDRVHVAQEQPWEHFLADSIQPIGDEYEPQPMGPDVDRPALGPGIIDQESEDG